MKVIHTVASIDEEAAGPSYTVPSMVAALGNLGHQAEVVTLGNSDHRYELGARVISCARDRVWPHSLMRLGRSKNMQRYLMECNADIFHANGLWMMPTIYPSEVARATGKPFLLTPRGMLGQDALKFSRAIKQGFWWAYQRGAMETASCIHATAESEFEDIRAFGLTQPVAIIPNGIHLPDLVTTSLAAPSSEPFILSLGRIHPKKALDRLISGFSIVAPDFPNWQLRIVGPDEGGYADKLKAQIANLGLMDRVSIEAPVFGSEKLLLMQKAELFVLSTLHENFAMTVAESLAVKTPVISTKGAPWAGLETYQCGWWIDHGCDAMATTLREALSLPAETRAAMGQRGRQWMKRDFDWLGIAEKMATVYHWLLNDSEQPKFVWN